MSSSDGRVTITFPSGEATFAQLFEDKRLQISTARTITIWIKLEALNEANPRGLPEVDALFELFALAIHLEELELINPLVHMTESSRMPSPKTVVPLRRMETLLVQYIGMSLPFYNFYSPYTMAVFWDGLSRRAKNIKTLCLRHIDCVERPSTDRPLLPFCRFWCYYLLPKFSTSKRLQILTVGVDPTNAAFQIPIAVHDLTYTLISARNIFVQLRSLLDGRIPFERLGKFTLEFPAREYRDHRSDGFTTRDVVLLNSLEENLSRLPSLRIVFGAAIDDLRGYQSTKHLWRFKQLSRLGIFLAPFLRRKAEFTLMVPLYKSAVELGNLQEFDGEYEQIVRSQIESIYSHPGVTHSISLVSIHVN